MTDLSMGRRRLGRLALGCLAVLVVAAPSAAAAGEKKLPPLKVHIDKSKVDLDSHTLEVKLSRTASRVQLRVYGESGALIAEQEQDFEGAPAGKALKVSWTPSTDEAVGKIEVYGHDAFGYYAGVAIIPWSVSIPHEEVNFETNSAAIRASEAPKLEDSAGKIRAAVEEHKELGRITLFIAGHTDTVGSAEHNLGLSRRRARAIAQWFRTHGLRIPIAYEGFGEKAPLVKTKDEVDEPRNRRGDYVLSVDVPTFKSSGKAPAWKQL